MRSRSIQILAFGFIAAGIVQSPSRVLGQAQVRPDSQKASAQQTKITISKETTFITEPLRKDGYPDYIRYIDEKQKKGITPDNNATVLLIRTLGPGDIAEKQREDFFKRLGIDPLPAGGDYFISWFNYSKQYSAKDWPAVPRGDTRSAREFFEDLDGEANSRPWTREDFPQLAKWLEANDKHIDQFVAASKRPGVYTPLITGDEQQTLVAVLLPVVQNCRQAARALVTRAIYRAGSGNFKGAVEDLTACHRLARITAKGFSLIEGLVAVAMDHMALDAEATLIAADRMTADQRASLRKELSALPPMRSMADALDQGERLMYMDSVCWIARQGASALRQLSAFSETPNKAQPALDLLGNLAVDWNVPLRVGNEWYDRYVKIARMEDPNQRLAALGQIERDIKAAAAEVKSASSALGAIFSPRETASKLMANVFIALLLPALNSAMQAEHRNEAKQSLVTLGLALADYRDEHKQFPDDLDALAPKYVNKIPLDPMWGEPFVYRKTDAGFVLYALGQNGKDDGGIKAGEAGDADDLVIAVRPEKASK